MHKRHAAVSVRPPLSQERSNDHPQTAGPGLALTVAPLTPADLLAELQRRIGSARVQRDFAGGATVRAADAGELVVHAQSPAAAQVLARRYSQVIDEIARQHEVTVRFEGPSTAPAPQAPKPPQRASRRTQAPAHRHPRLADMIDGPCNRLALDAAKRIAAGELSPGAALYIHGGCGLGKTLLLMGLIDHAQSTRPGCSARYMTAEEFANEFIGAVKSAKPDRMDRFRRQFRSLDLLCLDDLQCLATKAATQVELQHTIDAIASRGGRIVAAAPAAPRSITGLSDALTSRFLSGLVVEVAPPDADTGARIVQAIAGRRGLVIDPAAASAMVQAVALTPGARAISVRDLEGLVVKVEAVHRLLGAGRVSTPGAPSSHVIGLISVQRALGGPGGGEANGGVIARIGPRPPVRLENVVALTSQTFGVSHAEVAGRGRHERVVLTRAISTFLARKHTSASYPEIARALGRPNHSTVITAHQRLTRQLEASLTVELADGHGPRFVRDIITELSRRLAGLEAPGTHHAPAARPASQRVP